MTLIHEVQLSGKSDVPVVSNENVIKQNTSALILVSKVSTSFLLLISVGSVIV